MSGTTVAFIIFCAAFGVQHISVSTNQVGEPEKVSTRRIVTWLSAVQLFGTLMYAHGPPVLQWVAVAMWASLAIGASFERARILAVRARIAEDASVGRARGELHTLAMPSDELAAKVQENERVQRSVRRTLSGE